MADPRFGTAVATPSQQSVLATNKVLRNTYMLLAMALGFSAITATVSMSMNVPYNPLIMLGGFFGLLFLVHKTADSVWGLVSVFALTGFMGVMLGPILNYYLSTANGSANVAQAMGLTAFTFIGLSAYVVTSKADMSFLRGFIAAGMLILLGIIGIYVVMYLTGNSIPSGIGLAISGFVVLLMSAYILWQTSSIVHGGETNYILAATGLFVSIYNLFTSLLHLIGFMSDD